LKRLKHRGQADLYIHYRIIIDVKISRQTVIIAAAMAIVVIILAAGLVLYDPLEHYEPEIGLSDGTEVEPGLWRLEIYTVSSSEFLTGFNITLTKNGNIIEIPATPLNELDSNCGGSPGISFVDRQGNGLLDLGDWFEVCETDSVGKYQVEIFWRESGHRVSGNEGHIAE
jgi:hypothetical protein